MRRYLLVAVVLPALPGLLMVLITFFYIPSLEPLIAKVAPRLSGDYVGWKKQYTFSVGQRVVISLSPRILWQCLPASLIISVGLVIYTVGSVLFLRVLR